MILDTPTAERTIPTKTAAVPWIIRPPPIFVRPTLGPKIEKDRIERIGGNAEATNFFQDANDEIEAIVRNRMGKDKASTTKNPAAQNPGFEAAIPAIAPSGNATMRRNHDRISSPISRRKFRTLSPRRNILEFRASPTMVGITTAIKGKSTAVWSPTPASGRARIDESNARVRKTETTSGVDGKPTRLMKLKAPTVPPTPPDAF
jgi:hypothetical protein